MTPGQQRGMGPGSSIINLRRNSHDARLEQLPRFLLERVGDLPSRTPTRFAVWSRSTTRSKTGQLEPKIHELIALAVAVTTPAATVAFPCIRKRRREVKHPSRRRR